MRSAVNLGGGYMLTSNHFYIIPFVTFDGRKLYNCDLSMIPQQVAPNVDIKIFKLTSNPTVGAENFYGDSNEQIAPTSLVGWRVGINPDVPVNSVLVNWGSYNTNEKRWVTDA
jgi:hypothetical protein